MKIIIVLIAITIVVAAVYYFGNKALKNERY